MLNGSVQCKRERSRVFQALLLDNDKTQDVEVHEAQQIDFMRIQEHLERGGSVFITSKNSQKLKMPKRSKASSVQNKNKPHTVRAFFFDHL
jgi:hypothetical protein